VYKLKPERIKEDKIHAPRYGVIKCVDMMEKIN
jgi:hypothetical protein